MKKILRNIKKAKETLSFGKKDIEIGEPIRTDYQGALKYFDQVYQNSDVYIKSLIKRLKLYNKKVVSIGSGFGAEEILLSQLGNNYIDCIEPDNFSRKVHTNLINKFGIEKIQLHNSTVQSFDSKEKFDLIYSSSPSDWMCSDFRNIIPQKYINFFNKFGADKSFVVLKLYGGNYHEDILRDNWFLKSLIEKFNKKSKYRLIEYWLSKSEKMTTVIASNYLLELSEDPMFKFCSQRTGEISDLKYKFSSSNNVKLYKYEKITPYIIVLKRLIEKVKNRILKI